MLKYIVYISTISLTLLSGGYIQAQDSELELERSSILAISGISEERNIVLKPETTGPGAVSQHLISTNNSEYSRFRFTIPNDSACRSGWSIVVQTRNEHGEYITTWEQRADDMREQVIWSPEIPGKEVRIQLHIDDTESKARVILDRIARSQEPIYPLSIVGEDEREPIGVYPDDIKSLGKAVAKIRFVGDDGPIYNCTGFLLNKELMLTNEHCINSDSERQSAIIAFDYDKKLSHEVLNELSELVYKNYDLDYSLVRLAKPVERSPLKLATSKVSRKKKLFVIQHPAGEPKQISSKGCIVNKRSVRGRGKHKTDFSHKCDTLGGSSGAPVFLAENYEVVGLHHLGFKKGSGKVFNRAVHITQVIKDLKQNNVELGNE